jgi:hypothetical protein
MFVLFINVLNLILGESIEIQFLIGFEMTRENVSP